MTGEAPSSNEAGGNALLPLAAVPALVALALVVPAPYDPRAPLATLPSLFWFFLALAVLAPVVTIPLARTFTPDRETRKRLLADGIRGVSIGTIAVVIATLLLGEAILEKSGGGWILVAASLAMAAAAAGGLAFAPRLPFARGVLLGELVFAILVRVVFAPPSAPDERVRHAMIVAPGWGQSNLAALAVRALRGPIERPRYEQTLRALDAELMRMIEDGSFAPPYTRWGDDARVVRGWIAIRISAASGLAPAERDAMLRTAVREQMLFAASPASSLEPFTAGGVLARNALDLTGDLEVPVDLRFRIAAAWGALELHALVLDDPEGEVRAKELLRALFEKNHLDRTDPLYLGIISLERRRFVEAGDAAGFIAYFDVLSAGDWPEGLKVSFKRDADFVRAHPDEEYRPVMQLLLARARADQDERAGIAAYKALLAKWPGSSVATTARVELAEVEQRKKSP